MLGDSLIISTSSPPFSSIKLNKLPTDPKSKSISNEKLSVKSDINKSTVAVSKNDPPSSLDPPTIPNAQTPTDPLAASQQNNLKTDPPPSSANGDVNNSKNPSKISIQKTRIYIPGIHKTKLKKSVTGGKCVNIIQNAPNEYTTIG